MIKRGAGVSAQDCQCPCHMLVGDLMFVKDTKYYLSSLSFARVKLLTIRIDSLSKLANSYSMLY